MVIRATLSLLVSVCLVLLIGDTGCADRCSYNLLGQSSSPDQRWEAVAFLRNCGALAGFTINVSLARAGDELPRGRGNVFAAGPTSQHPGSLWVNIAWEGAERLVVTYDGGVFVEKQRPSFDGIGIEYRPIR